MSLQLTPERPRAAGRWSLQLTFLVLVALLAAYTPSRFQAPFLTLASQASGPVATSNGPQWPKHR